jgi:hypothetical protein
VRDDTHEPFSSSFSIFRFSFLFVIRASLYDTGVRASLILGALVMGILDSWARALYTYSPWF